MKVLSDLIKTTLSTAGIDITQLTKAYQSLRGVRSDASRFQQMINCKRVVELQTKTADISNTAIELVDLCLQDIDVEQSQMRRQNLRSGPRYPHDMPASYSKELMRASVANILSSCGWPMNDDYVVTDWGTSQPVYVSGISGGSVKLQLISYDDKVCLSVGEDDGAYYLTLHDVNPYPGVEASWPGIIYWTHFGIDGTAPDEATAIAVEMGLVKQQDGSWASLSAIMATLSARESSYALLNDLCDAAYTNATIPITTVNAIVSTYGESEVSSFVKSMVSGYNELDCTSVLSIVASALDNMIGDADDSGTTFVPKENPGFMDDLVGTVVSIVIMALSTIVSIFLKGVGVILLGVASIVTQLLPKILQVVDQTDFDVIKVNMLPCWNVVGPAGIWTPVGSWLTSFLDDRLAVDGMVFMPISSFIGCQENDITDLDRDEMTIYDMAYSAGVLLYPKTNSGYPYQWVIPLRSVPSDNISQCIEPITTYYSSLTVGQGRIVAPIFPRTTDPVVSQSPFVPYPGQIDNLDWTGYSTNQLKISIIYSMLMVGWDLGRSFRWLYTWTPYFTHNYDLGSYSDWTSVTGIFSTGFDTVKQWVLDSFSTFTPQQQAETGITSGFLYDLSVMVLFYLIPFILTALTGHGVITTWTDLSDASITDIYSVLTSSTPFQSLGIAFLSWLERDSWFALYQSAWLAPLSPRVSEENCQALLTLWSDELAPGQPAYDSCVLWPKVSARSIVRGLIMTAVTVALVGSSIFIARKAMKRRAVPRLTLREKEFSEAQAAVVKHPTDKKAQKRLYKANKRLTKAWKKAGRAGVSMYNGFDTGAANSLSTMADAVAFSTADGGLDTSTSSQYAFDRINALLSGQPMGTP